MNFYINVFGLLDIEWWLEIKWVFDFLLLEEGYFFGLVFGMRNGDVEELCRGSGLNYI